VPLTGRPWRSLIIIHDVYAEAEECDTRWVFPTVKTCRSKSPKSCERGTKFTDSATYEVTDPEFEL